MKSKKNKRKLALNKISIAPLDNDKIHEVKEGLELIKGGNVTDYPPPICRTN